MVDVLQLMKRGYPRARIAYELGISQSTLDTYLWRIFVRLDAGNSVEAVARAMDQGWIE